MNRLILILGTLHFLTSCSEIKSADPNEVYKYWSGTEAPADLQLLEGQYWQSAHWTREYIMYLKLKPTKKWSSEFIDQNQLQIDNENWSMPTDAPDWFKTKDNKVIYSSGDEFDQGSRYYLDTLTGDFYIYEIQL